METGRETRSGIWSSNAIRSFDSCFDKCVEAYEDEFRDFNVFVLSYSFVPFFYSILKKPEVAIDLNETRRL